MEDVILVESREFTAWVGEYLADEDLAALQQTLRSDPSAGAVMPGCGGLRKIRVADPGRGKGKRGGARVVYPHVPEDRLIHLITVYGKDQKDDLTAEDKKMYRRIAQILKRSR